MSYMQMHLVPAKSCWICQCTEVVFLCRMEAFDVKNILPLTALLLGTPVAEYVCICFCSVFQNIGAECPIEAKIFKVVLDFCWLGFYT